VISFVSFLILINKAKHLTGYDALIISLFASFFFAIFIYDFLKILSKHFHKSRLPTNTIAFVVYLVLFWIFIKGLGKENARNTTSNNKHFASFQYEGKLYQTSKDTIIVGDTKRYIILRSLKDSANFFFERDRISSLKTKK